MLMGESMSHTSKTCLFVVMFKWFGYRIYHKYWTSQFPCKLFLKSFKNDFFFNLMRSSFVSLDQNIPMQVV